MSRQRLHHREVLSGITVLFPLRPRWLNLHKTKPAQPKVNLADFISLCHQSSYQSVLLNNSTYMLPVTDISLFIIAPVLYSSSLAFGIPQWRNMRSHSISRPNHSTVLNTFCISISQSTEYKRLWAAGMQETLLTIKIWEYNTWKEDRFI